MDMDINEFVPDHLKNLQNAKSDDMTLFVAEKRKEYLRKCLEDDFLPGVGVRIEDEDIEPTYRLSEKSKEKLKETVRELIKEEIKNLES